ATTIAKTDGVRRRPEADAVTMIRSDFIVLNNIETAITNQQRELLDLIDEEKIRWDKVCELGQVLIGRHPGRTSNRQIIYYKSNTGVGIQFAAAGALIYEACRKRARPRAAPREVCGRDERGCVDGGFAVSVKR